MRKLLSMYLKNEKRANSIMGRELVHVRTGTEMGTISGMDKKFVYLESTTEGPVSIFRDTGRYYELR